MATGSGAGSSFTDAQHEELLTAIRNMEGKVEEKSLTLKSEMLEESDDRLVKKIRLDNKLMFKKCGHKKQYQHNEQVRKKLNAADSALGQTPPAVEKARTFLKEGEKLINLRQRTC